jgi:UDP-N-acetylmuramoyl-tripeptide--D-alanyl-D-alanine ligase
VGEYAVKADVDTLVCVGSDAKEIANTAMGRIENVAYFENKADAVEYLNGTLLSGDTVLFKASRGMKFEEIMNSLKLLKQ